MTLVYLPRGFFSLITLLIYTVYLICLFTTSYYFFTTSWLPPRLYIILKFLVKRVIAMCGIWKQNSNLSKDCTSNLSLLSELMQSSSTVAQCNKNNLESATGMYYKVWPSSNINLDRYHKMGQLLQSATLKSLNNFTNPMKAVLL